MMKSRAFVFVTVHVIFIFFIGLTPLISQQNREEIRSQLDIEPNEDQVSYSPADGETVKVNPPPFTWLPVKKDITYPPDYVEYSGPREEVWKPIKQDYTYTLQISRDRYFRSDVITRTGIEISTYPLDTSLDAGEWFWRYGAEVENGETLYSKTRRFIVPPEVMKRPFPDIEQVINSISTSHPRLFIQKDEMNSYRSRALHGDLKETVTEIRNDIEGHIGEELPAEPKWVEGIGPEFGEHSWRLIYDATIPAIDLAETFGLVYLLTGDETYGEEARRRLLHFARWDPDGPSSRRGHNETAYRIVDQGSRAYDWTYDLFTSGERELVKTSMKRRIEQLYNLLKDKPDGAYHVYPYSSHQERITGFVGQAAITFADEWDEAADWLEYALTIHWNMYPAWGKEDGGWHQGPSYWSAYQSRVLHFIMAVKNATGVDLMQKEFFQNTPYYILYTNPPYARLSPFGDGSERPPSRSRGEVMYSYSSILQNPYFRWYADYLDAGYAHNILGILLKNDDIEGKPPTDLPQSRYFPGVGLVSLHTDFGNAEEDIHFLFQSDPYGGVFHGHPNQNAFTIEAFGEALAIKSGYYPWAGSDHNMQWSRNTKSSNSITIDGGQGQERLAEAKGEVVRFENRDLYDYVLGDATRAYMGLLDKFHRHVIHIRPGVYVMYDDLEAPDPVTFEWWLHALSQMNANESDQSIVISEGDARLKVHFLQAGKLKFEQSGFPVFPEVRGESTPDYKNQWHVTASTVSKSTKSKFITVFVPYKLNQEPDVSVDRVVENENEVSVELDIEGKTYRVSFLPEVSVEEIPSTE